MSVSSCTTTSGEAAATASFTATSSSASITTGSVPQLTQSFGLGGCARGADHLVATLDERGDEAGTVAPDAPATKIFMTFLLPTGYPWDEAGNGCVTPRARAGGVTSGAVISSGRAMSEQMDVEEFEGFRPLLFSIVPHGG